MSNTVRCDTDLFGPGHVYASRCFNGGYALAGGGVVPVGTTITLYEPASEIGPISGELFFIEPVGGAPGPVAAAAVSFSLTPGKGFACESPAGWTCLEVWVDPAKNTAAGRFTLDVHEHPS